MARLILPCVTFLIILLSGCSPNEGQQRAKFSLSQMRNQSVDSVTSITGYLIYESHARQLWSSKYFYKKGDTEQCLTLIATSSHHRILTSYNRRIVRINGKLNDDVTTGYVDLGACNKFGIEVISVQEESSGNVTKFPAKTSPPLPMTTKAGRSGSPASPV